MPYDEQKCADYIIALDTKSNSLQDQIMQIKTIRDNFVMIKTVKQKTLHDDESVSVDLVIPTDSRTGKPFTTEDRDAIFDTNAALADKI